MRKLIVRGKAAMNRVKMICVTAVKSGEGYLDVLIKILITVIIGAALLAIMRTAVPELFQEIIDKIKAVFTV